MLVGFGDELAGELAKSLGQQLAASNPELAANADVAQSMALFVVRVLPARAARHMGD